MYNDLTPRNTRSLEYGKYVLGDLDGNEIFGYGLIEFEHDKILESMRPEGLEDGEPPQITVIDSGTFRIDSENNTITLYEGTNPERTRDFLKAAFLGYSVHMVKVYRC